jgi:hypothetical protein
MIPVFRLSYKCSIGPGYIYVHESSIPYVATIGYGANTLGYSVLVASVNLTVLSTLKKAKKISQIPNDAEA